MREYSPICILNFLSEGRRGKQDQQCTYNLILRRLRLTTSAVEMKQVLQVMCVSTLP